MLKVSSIDFSFYCMEAEGTKMTIISTKIPFYVDKLLLIQFYILMRYKNIYTSDCQSLEINIFSLLVMYLIKFTLAEDPGSIFQR